LAVEPTASVSPSSPTSNSVVWPSSVTTAAVSPSAVMLWMSCCSSPSSSLWK